jgi:hypothetical protein
MFLQFFGIFLILIYTRRSGKDWLTAKLLLALASTVLLGSESRGTNDHILLSHVSGSRATFS